MKAGVYLGDLRVHPCSAPLNIQGLLGTLGREGQGWDRDWGGDIGLGVSGTGAFGCFWDWGHSVGSFGTGAWEVLVGSSFRSVVWGLRDSASDFMF